MPRANTDLINVGLHGRIELNNGRLRSEALINNGAIVGHGRIDNEQTILNQINGLVEVGSGDRMVVNGGTTGNLGFDNDGEVVCRRRRNRVPGTVHELNQAAARHAARRCCAFSNSNDGLRLRQHRRRAGHAPAAPTTSTARCGFQARSSRIVVAGESTAVFHEPVTNGGARSRFFPDRTPIFLQGLLTFGAAPAPVLSVHLSDPRDEPGLARVEVVGTAQLAGNLQITLAGGFLPQPGDQFTVLQFGRSRRNNLRAP